MSTKTKPFDLGQFAGHTEGPLHEEPRINGSVACDDRGQVVFPLEGIQKNADVIMLLKSPELIAEIERLQKACGAKDEILKMVEFTLLHPLIEGGPRGHAQDTANKLLGPVQRAWLRQEHPIFAEPVKMVGVR